MGERVFLSFQLLYKAVRGFLMSHVPLTTKDMTAYLSSFRAMFLGPTHACFFWGPGYRLIDAVLT